MEDTEVDMEDLVVDMEELVEVLIEPIRQADLLQQDPKIHHINQAKEQLNPIKLIKQQYQLILREEWD
jgi:hypothetical protein